MIRFRSPGSGWHLEPDTPHSLRDAAGERWPVIDGIAYLRAGSEALAAAVLERLDAGDRRGALLLLLAENDRWWTEPPPPREQLRRLVDEQHRLTLRDAMALLGWGRVGDYFAHRWSDPTFVAGLTLMDAHWPEPDSAFELACGIGHYLRALAQAGVAAVGADVVFAKLWVARHWVAPEATLLCFDADQPWPVDLRTDLAFCHDAFYFLQQKRRVAAALRAVAPAVLLAHVHNRDAANFSGGSGMTLGEVRQLFPAATLYADEALTEAGVAGRLPDEGAGETTEAFAVAVGARRRHQAGSFAAPQPGAALRRNPLCQPNGPAWPSDRYRDEYAGRATYRCDPALPERVTMAPQWLDAVRRRDLVDLPERW